ncbi:MAG TPA: PAC2 family protein, partial [Dehalococcoidia bacterium]|nr:PAC2 family protein [Dehalococcoidia bacterium]
MSTFGSSKDVLRSISEMELRNPILVCAWSGWNDAGMAASDAVAFVRTRLKFEKVADIDPDFFYDFTQVRPTVHISNGERVLNWPVNLLSGQRRENQDNDLLLLHGIEPHLAWQTYVGTIIEICRKYSVSGVVLLGALLSDVSHRADATVTGSATEDWLAELLKLETSQKRPSYEGPTGIVGVMSNALREAEIPSASLWANAPYYLGSGKNPRCQLALLQRLNESLNLDMSLHDMESRITRWEARIESELGKDPEMADLANKVEESSGDSELDLPDSDEILDDIDDF